MEHEKGRREKNKIYIYIREHKTLRAFNTKNKTTQKEE